MMCIYIFFYMIYYDFLFLVIYNYSTVVFCLQFQLRRDRLLFMLLLMVCRVE